MATKPKNHRYYRVFVPAPTAQLGINLRSAIVAREPLEVFDDCVRIHFEGDLYGMDNLQTFAQRLHHAADRDSADYPTMAKLHVRLSELIDVARYDLFTGQISDLVDLPALTDWLAGEQLADDDLAPRYVLAMRASALHDDERATMFLTPGLDWSDYEAALLFTQSQRDAWTRGQAVQLPPPLTAALSGPADATEWRQVEGYTPT